jgi:hypothetical protein
MRLLKGVRISREKHTELSEHHVNRRKYMKEYYKKNHAKLSVYMENYRIKKILEELAKDRNKNV